MNIPPSHLSKSNPRKVKVSSGFIHVMCFTLNLFNKPLFKFILGCIQKNSILCKYARPNKFKGEERIIQQLLWQILLLLPILVQKNLSANYLHLFQKKKLLERAKRILLDNLMPTYPTSKQGLGPAVVSQLNDPMKLVN